MIGRQCGRYGTSSAGRTVHDPADEHFWWQEFPPEIRDLDFLCRECASEVNLLTPESMSDTDLCAAIVYDSHGYASPGHAAQHVAAFRDGDDKAHCERATSCFDRDLSALIESAVQRWGGLSEEKQDSLREQVQKWEELESESTIASMAVSMSAPVGGL